MRLLTVLVIYTRLKKFKIQHIQKYLNFLLDLCNCVIYFNNKEINKMIKSIQIVIKFLLFKIINCHIYFNEKYPRIALRKFMSQI